MKKAKIIVINGVSRSGKDTFVKFLKNKTLGILEHSTIDTIVAALDDFNMIDISRKTTKEREFIATVKQAWIKYNNGPFEEVKHIVRRMAHAYKYLILVIHVREPEEIKKLRDYFKEDFTSVLVIRDDAKPQHTTDNFVNMMDYDYMVYNNGTLEDLEKETVKFLEFLNKEK